MVLTVGVAACLGVVAWFTWNLVALALGFFVMASAVPLHPQDGEPRSANGGRFPAFRYV